MTIDEYNQTREGEILRAGYTTGTSATAAAVAALTLWFYKKEINEVSVELPIGITLDIPIEENQMDESSACCGVRKNGGDDPDATDGMMIYAKVSFELGEESEVKIFGGEGIGRVSCPGLDQPIGEAAINSIPRKMIRENLLKRTKEWGLKGKISVTIFAPEGEEVAKRTFNPKLGIVGGISILGTTGIVAPMSVKALVDTIKVDMHYHMQKDYPIIAVPGNYGIRFLSEKYGIESDMTVEFSNYIGEAIDMAVHMGVEEMLICGHLGKLIKVAGNIMNTHSNDSDCRMELMAAHLLKVEETLLSPEQTLSLARKILNANTTEEGTRLLKDQGILKEVMNSLGEAMYMAVMQRAKRAQNLRDKHNKESGPLIKIGIISFTVDEGELICAGEAKRLQKKIRKVRE